MAVALALRRGATMNANTAMLVLQARSGLRNETGSCVLRILFLLLLFVSLTSFVMAQGGDPAPDSGVTGIDAVAAAGSPALAGLPGTGEGPAPAAAAVRQSTVILWDETGSGSKGTARVGADDAAETGVSGTDKAH
jgi:hypothetical protein